jgi:hypothetical protein
MEWFVFTIYKSCFFLHHSIRASDLVSQSFTSEVNLNAIIIFQVPPESIERAAGLLFFDKLSREKIRKINGRKV